MLFYPHFCRSACVFLKKPVATQSHPDTGVELHQVQYQTPTPKKQGIACFKNPWPTCMSSGAKTNPAALFLTTVHEKVSLTCSLRVVWAHSMQHISFTTNSFQTFSLEFNFWPSNQNPDGFGMAWGGPKHSDNHPVLFCGRHPGCRTKGVRHPWDGKRFSTGHLDGSGLQQGVITPWLQQACMYSSLPSRPSFSLLLMVGLWGHCLAKTWVSLQTITYL